MPAASTREGSRRQHDRAAVEVRVDLSPDTTARFIRGRSCNAAEGGLFVTTDALLRVDGRVRLGFMIEDGGLPVRGEARVVWVREEPEGDGLPEGAGLEFLSFEDDGAERVARWCGRLRENQPKPPPPIPVRLEVVAPSEESQRTEVFDGTGVFLTRGAVASTTPRTDVFVVDDPLEDTAVLPGRAARKGRGGLLWIAVLVLLVVAAAAVVLERERIAGWLERLGGEPGAGVFSTPTVAAAAAPGARSDLEPSTEPETPSAADTAAPLPTLLGVACHDEGETSVVALELTAIVAVEQVGVESLADPARALVRLVGVTGDPEAAPVEAVGTRVQAIRIGLHEDLTPPELHVVLDLDDAGSGIVGWWIEGKTVEVVVGPLSPEPPAPAASAAS